VALTMTCGGVLATATVSGFTPRAANSWWRRQ